MLLENTTRKKQMELCNAWDVFRPEERAHHDDHGGDSPGHREEIFLRRIFGTEEEVEKVAELCGYPTRGGYARLRPSLTTQEEEVHPATEVLEAFSSDN